MKWNGKLVVVSTKVEAGVRRGLRAQARKRRLTVSQYIALLVQQDIKRSRRARQRQAKEDVALQNEMKTAEAEETLA